MITILGLSLTWLQLIEAVPSIVAAIRAVASVVQQLEPSSSTTAPTIMGKAVIGALAKSSGQQNPTPFTTEEQAIWDRASAMS